MIKILKLIFKIISIISLTFTSIYVIMFIVGKDIKHYSIMELR